VVGLKKGKINAGGSYATPAKLGLTKK